MSYYDKYIKYKTKYNKLKKQKGGVKVYWKNELKNDTLDKNDDGSYKYLQKNIKFPIEINITNEEIKKEIDANLDKGELIYGYYYFKSNNNNQEFGLVLNYDKIKDAKILKTNKNILEKLITSNFDFQKTYSEGNDITKLLMQTPSSSGLINLASEKIPSQEPHQPNIIFKSGITDRKIIINKGFMYKHTKIVSGNSVYPVVYKSDIYFFPISNDGYLSQFYTFIKAKLSKNSIGKNSIVDIVIEFYESKENHRSMIEQPKNEQERVKREKNLRIDGIINSNKEIDKLMEEIKDEEGNIEKEKKIITNNNIHMRCIHLAEFNNKSNEQDKSKALEICKTEIKEAITKSTIIKNLNIKIDNINKIIKTLRQTIKNHTDFLNKQQTSII